MTQGRDVRLPRLSRMASSKRNINSNSQIFKKRLIAVAAAFAIATIVVVTGSINAPADVATTPVNVGEALTSAETHFVYAADKKRLRGFSEKQRPSKDKTAAAMRLGDGTKTNETLQDRLIPPERRREPNEDIMAQAADAAARAAVEVEMKTKAAVVGAAETDAEEAVIYAEAVWDGAWDAPLEETFNEFNPGEAEAPADAANEDILAQAAEAAARAASKVEMAAEAAMAGAPVTDAEAVLETVWDAPVEKTLNEFNAAPAEVAS